MSKMGHQLRKTIYIIALLLAAFALIFIMDEFGNQPIPVNAMTLDKAETHHFEK